MAVAPGILDRNAVQEIGDGRSEPVAYHAIGYEDDLATKRGASGEQPTIQEQDRELGGRGGGKVEEGCDPVQLCVQDVCRAVFFGWR